MQGVDIADKELEKMYLPYYMASKSLGLKNEIITSFLGERKLMKNLLTQFRNNNHITFKDFINFDNI